jgi:hypothetical protein
VLVLLLVPIAAVLPLSFSSGSFLSYPVPGLSLRWCEELLTNYKLREFFPSRNIEGFCELGTDRIWTHPRMQRSARFC